MRIQLTPLAVLPFLTLACGPSAEDLANGDDPIASLRSTVRSSRFGEQYWRHELRSRSTVWAKAIEYCDAAEKADYPNCEVVRGVKFVGSGAPINDSADSTKGFNL